MGTWIASPASHLRFNGAPVPHFHLCDTISCGDYPSGYFVTLHHRIWCIGMFAEIYMDITSAYPDIGDLDQYLIACDLCNRYLSQFDVSGSGHNRLIHGVISQ